MQSRRDCKADKRFDRLVAILFDDVDEYEKQVFVSLSLGVLNSMSAAAFEKERKDLTSCILCDAASGQGGFGKGVPAWSGALQVLLRPFPHPFNTSFALEDPTACGMSGQLV